MSDDLRVNDCGPLACDIAQTDSQSVFYSDGVDSHVGIES